MQVNQNEEEALTVPKIISDQKFSDFLKQIPLTIFGLQSQKVPLIILIIIGFILSAIIVIIPLLVEIYAIAVIAPILSLPTIIFIFDITSSCILQDRQCCINIFLKLQTWIKYLSLAVYGFLWSNHFYLCSNSQSYIPCIIGSVIGVLTSINSISFEGVKEFTSSSPNFTNYGIQETRGIRLLIIVPTFLAEFIIRAAYGFERCDNLLENIEGLLVFNSFIWISWIFGWVSSIGNTYKYIINTFNHYVLGEEKIENGIILLASFILNLVPWGLACIPVEGNIYRLYILAIGATITCWIIAIINILLSQKLTKDHYLRFFIISAIELVNLGALLILLGLVTFRWQTFLVVTAINIFFFVMLEIIKEFFLARNHFGLRLCTSELVYPPFFSLIQRLLLRLTSSICIVWASLGLVSIQWQTRSYLAWNMNTITYFLTPVLVYRSFKRCLSESRSFSLHLSIIISLILIAIGLQETKYAAIFVILLMPPFPQNFYLAFLSPFLIPQKALRKNQCLYRFLYYFTTLIGVFLYIITLWTLQWTMIFGMPMFWPVIPSNMSISSNTTVQQSLYRKILQNLDSSIFRGLKKGMYLLRIDKYIVYIQVKLECYGLLEILQFRGMEAQEVTSCHSREGQTLDRIVQETWNENSSKTFTIDPYKTVLWPICKKQIQVPVQNQIKLTGIIQTADYLQLFKSATIKSLIHFFQKFQLSIQMKNQGQVILSQLSAITKKQPAQSVFPFQFSKQYSKQYSVQLQSNKKKLPPITKQKKKDTILGDYLDLLGGGNDSSIKRQAVQPVINLGEQQNSQHALNQQPSISYSKTQQINLSIVMTFYSYMVARHDYFNTNRIVSLIRQEKDALPQIQFQNKEKFASRAISAAMKISIDKYLQGQTQINKQDFENYEKNQFLGVIQSEGFAEATRTDKQDIWTVSVSKKQLNIKRLAKADTNLYLFGLDGWLVKSVWNNLRFQLLYAANDDDERYSIQTHPNLLRNLWVEACEEPFGYAGFYSGSISNI